MAFRHLADMTSGYGLPEVPGAAFAYSDYAIALYIDTMDKVFGGNGDHSHLVSAGNDRFRDPMQFQDGTLFESSKGRVRSSARDFARMGWMWMNRGYWNGNQLLPRSFFDNYMKADVPDNLPRTSTSSGNDYLGVGTYGGGFDQDAYVHGIYGFNWWFNKNSDPNHPTLTWADAPVDTFLANGRDGKDCMAMIPSLGLVVAAWNDSNPSAWGTSIPETNCEMNKSLKLLKESCINVTDRAWKVSSGSWADPNNWDPTGGSVGLPNSLRRARVDNGGTCNITGGTAKVLYVGDQSAGTAAQTSGTLTTEYVVVGYQGKGVFNHSGGTNAPSQALHVGYFAGSSGTYRLSGSGFVNAPNEYLSGVGCITQSGGLNTVAGTLTIGSLAGSGAAYQLQGGTLKATTIRRGSGSGSLQFTGGTLMASSVQMDLTNAGGVLCPGQSVGNTTITGNFQQTAGELEMELASAGSFDALTVTGGAGLGGTLNVLASYRPKEGDTFSIITAASFSGAFSSFASNITTGLPVGQDAFSGQIVVEPSSDDRYVATFNGWTGGDALGDHAVSLGDIGIVAGNWGDPNQTWAQGDFTGDGLVGLGDLGILAGNWGWVKPAGAPVPEPTALALVGAGSLALLRRQRR